MGLRKGAGCNHLISISVDEAFNAYEAVRRRLPPPRCSDRHVRHVETLADIARDYDVFLLDACGVLTIGTTGIPGVRVPSSSPIPALSPGTKAGFRPSRVISRTVWPTGQGSRKHSSANPSTRFQSCLRTAGRGRAFANHHGGRPPARRHSLGTICWHEFGPDGVLRPFRRKRRRARRGLDRHCSRLHCGASMTDLAAMSSSGCAGTTLGIMAACAANSKTKKGRRP